MCVLALAACTTSSLCIVSAAADWNHCRASPSPASAALPQRAATPPPARASTPVLPKAKRVADFGKGRAGSAAPAAMSAPELAVYGAQQGSLRRCLLGILASGAKLKLKVRIMTQLTALHACVPTLWVLLDPAALRHCCLQYSLQAGRRRCTSQLLSKPVPAPDAVGFSALTSLSVSSTSCRWWATQPNGRLRCARQTQTS